MNVNSLITKDYRKKDDFAVPKNKANSNPISNTAFSIFSPEIKIMNNEFFGSNQGKL